MTPKKRGKTSDPLADFCSKIDIPEISLSEWEDCHQALDLTVPLFVSPSEADSGAERTLTFSRTVTSDGKPSRTKVQCQITVPQAAKDGQTLVVPGAGDSRDGCAGDLKVIIRVKRPS